MMMYPIETHGGLISSFDISETCQEMVFGNTTGWFIVNFLLEIPAIQEIWHVRRHTYIYMYMIYTIYYVLFMIPPIVYKTCTKNVLLILTSNLLNFTPSDSSTFCLSVLFKLN